MKMMTVDLINQLFSFTSLVEIITIYICYYGLTVVFLQRIEYLSRPQTIFRKLGHVGFEDLNFSIYRG